MRLLSREFQFRNRLESSGVFYLVALWLLILLAMSAWAADDKTDRATLRGVKGVCTIVDVTAPAQVADLIDKSRLKADIDGRLAEAGIPVEKDATTCLYLNVSPLPAIGRNNKPIGLYAADFNLEFLQTVSLVRDSSVRTYSPTWSVANLANVPADDLPRTSRQVSLDLVERFVKAFRSVNPKSER